jgi:glutathione S-transferase
LEAIMQIAGTSLRPLEIWRSDVSLDEARNFATSTLATIVRLGSGGMVHGVGPRPHDALVLYELEWDPASRIVREALSELDLDALIKPCPSGESMHHRELAQLGESQFPYLIDRSAGVQLGDSTKIVEHLYASYGDGSPVPVRMRGALARLSSKLASELRRSKPYELPGERPELTLELWNYEASPYCRIAREELARLGLPYVSKNLARSSPRREDFRARFSREQFPRLYDPNNKTGLFETEAIVMHLQTFYGRMAALADESLVVHPA